MPNFAVIATGPRSLLVSWNHLKKDNTNGVILNYILRYKQLSTGMAYSHLSINSTLQSVSIEMKPYTNYSVSIAAVNLAGMGPYGSGTTVLMPEAGTILITILF